jgi:voltage-dependent calcium channel T type alpha-1I
MAIDHYNMSDSLIKGLYSANIALTSLFVLEMLIKVIGLGIKEYVRDGFNIFDSIVIFLGLLEYMGIGNKAVTVLRTFRLLRIFKIVRSWDGLRKLLQTVLASIQSIANLGLLMVLLIFIYSLVGMQFFSGDFIDSPDPDDEIVRFNYNSFSYAIVTNFVILTAENWNSVLAAFIYKDGWGAVLYFVTLIIFGNIMLLNLFLAILLNFISDNLEEQEKVEPLPQAIEDNNNNNKNEVNENEIIEEELDYIQEKLRVLAKLNNSEPTKSEITQQNRETQSA